MALADPEADDLCTLVYYLAMAMMTISEARAALPEVLNRVAEGEEVTITRHGRPIAVVVRPDIVWHQSGTDVVLGEPGGLVTALRERARRNGHSLQQEVNSLLAEADESPAALPPIQLKTVRTTTSSRWSRGEIYGDEGR
jgi:antitoxin (DNA-binding transcriptional repressor) of toxin-antitoxin stability system